MKKLYSCTLVKIVFIVFMLLLSFSYGNAQIINVTGNWIVNPTITEAGIDYASSIESADNQILIDLNMGKVLGLIFTGKVLVKYEPALAWNNNLQLSVKRTGDGASCLLCSLSGGNNYLVLSQTNQQFFSVKVTASLLGLLGSFSNIPIQLKLSGVSVTTPVDSYSCRVVFTVTGN